MRSVLSEGKSHLVNLADSATRRGYEADPGRFVREVRTLPKKVRTVVVDEIQKAPALLDDIQGIYDADPARYEFFLTGSSARNLRRESANLLPGRAHAFRLRPVSQLERAASATTQHARVLRPQSLGSRPSESPFPALQIERLLLLGSLPGVSLEKPAMAARTLDAYVENYLEEEVRKEAYARDLGAFSVFLKLAAIESGSQVNVSKLSTESGVPASSIKNYYQVLEDTFIGDWVRPYTRAGRKRLLTAPRFLIFDTGVRNACSDLGFESRLLELEGGRLFENWVGHELLARMAILGRGHALTFWRTVSGAEVDYVFETPREDIPIKVKWTKSPRPQDARHIETFLDLYKSRARRGFVICRCSTPQQLTDRVIALPWEQL